MNEEAAPGAKFDSLPHADQLRLLAELSREAMKKYPLPAGCSVDLINLSENATYKIEAGGRRWALRVHREGYHSHTAIRSELAWLIDLRATGVVTTPVPVPGLDGEIIQQVAHPAMPQPRNVVLFDWETGSEPGVDEDLRAPFEVLGEVTARMHRHVRQWQRPEWFERLTWDFDTSLGDQPHWGRWRDGMGMDSGKVDLFGKTVALIGQRLAAFGKGADRFGLIHCDLRLANGAGPKRAGVAAFAAVRGEQVGEDCQTEAGGQQNRGVPGVDRHSTFPIRSVGMPSRACTK
jgi:Ser/Thr protein kinase RdoA (MazF antagonist)